MEEDEKKSYWKVGGGKRQQLRTDSALLADREDFKFFFFFQMGRIGPVEKDDMSTSMYCPFHTGPGDIENHEKHPCFVMTMLSIIALCICWSTKL